MPSSVLAGLGLGLSLIIAIGAQNLYVLRQGVRREYALTVALVCMASDAALILAGVAGIGAVLAQAPWLIGVVRWAGAAFLVTYGLLAARRAWRPAAQGLRIEHDRGGDAPQSPGASRGAGATASVLEKPRTRITVLGTCLALTWLNPHVYLDTVFLLGSVANTHGDERWWFAAGAVLGSVIWFGSLAYGARMLGRWLRSPRAWRVLDATIAVVMIALGISLVLPH